MGPKSLFKNFFLNLFIRFSKSVWKDVLKLLTDFMWCICFDVYVRRQDFLEGKMEVISGETYEIYYSITRKSVTETDRWTLKKKSFRLLFYCTILKILIIFNYVSIKFSSKCSEEKLSVSYHPFLFCLQKLLKSELRVRELKICKRWNWSVPGDYHQQIVKNDCFESWRRIHMPKMG